MILRRQVKSFIALIGISLFLSLPAFGAKIGIGDEMGLSPFLDWQALETEHFKFVFPKELSEIAKRSADIYEEVHPVLVKVFEWAPDHKVQIVLVDNTDLANGLTSATAKIGMILLITPPENWFNTAYYEDWLRLLIIHEYAHYLNMDPTRSFYVPLRYLLGSTVLPNSLWPTWMLEGLAVYIETRFTKVGRGRSPYFEMILRAAVEAKVLDKPSFVTIDKLNGGVPTFPGGSIPYLFGYFMMNQLASGFNGDASLGALSTNSSQRIPYFINGNVSNITGGKSWYDLWDEFLESTKEKAYSDLGKIKTQPLTKPEYLTTEGIENLGTTLSPDGRYLVYNFDSPHEKRGVFLKDLKNPKAPPIRILRRHFGVGAAFNPDGKQIFFSDIEKQSGGYNLFSDLYLYDLETRNSHQISNKLRAKDPDVSPDQKSLTFSTSKDATTGLSMGTLSTIDGKVTLTDVQTLYWPEQFSRVSNPKFFDNGSSIVFSLHKNGKIGEDLYKYNIKTKAVSLLISNGHNNRFPFKGPKGELYFVSDLTGVDNVFRLTPKGSTEQYSNTTTGIWFPSFNATDNSIYAGVLTHTGWNLAQFKLNTSPVDSKKVTISNPRAPEIYDWKSNPKQDHSNSEIKTYEPWSSLLPRTWYPDFNCFSVDQCSVAGHALGFDTLDIHGYEVGAGYDFFFKKPVWGASYSNRNLGPTITLGAQNDISVSFQKDQKTQYFYDRSFNAAIDYTYEQLDWSLNPSFLYSNISSQEYEKIENINSTISNGADPSGLSAFRGMLFFSNSRASRLAVRPEGGRSSFLSLREYNLSNGPNWKFTASNREFFHLGNHIVLSPKIQGAFAQNLVKGFHSANATVETAVSPFRVSPGTKSDDITLRGPTGPKFEAKSVGYLGADLAVPLVSIFRGPGTYPVFFQNLYAVAFTEAVYFPNGEPGDFFYSAIGGGLKMTSKFFIHVPVTFSLEYHKGFGKDFNKGNVLFGLDADTTIF